MRTIPFIKMDGLGNDFVIIDCRKTKEIITLTPSEISKIADRRTGIGFDQLFILTKSDKADIKMTIYNGDGSLAGACGNGSRCIASLIFEEEPSKKEAFIEAPQSKILKAYLDKQISVNMGAPDFSWQAIGLAEEKDTLNISGLLPGLRACCVSMGNPHAVFFVEAVEKIDLAKLGPLVENNPLFVNRTNVEFAQIVNPSKILMRVWERGAGITQACGSGASATLAAAYKKGLSSNKAQIIMPGGTLEIENKNGEILMAGPVHKAFSGQFYI